MAGGVKRGLEVHGSVLKWTPLASFLSLLSLALQVRVGPGFRSLRVARYVPAALPCVVLSFLSLRGCLHAWVHTGRGAPVHYQGRRSRSGLVPTQRPLGCVWGGGRGLSGQPCAACADGRVSLSFKGHLFLVLWGAGDPQLMSSPVILPGYACLYSMAGRSSSVSDTRSVHRYQERASGLAGPGS